MPPPKTIIVNTDELLQNLADWSTERAADGRTGLDELKRRSGGGYFQSEATEFERAIDGWVPRKLDELAGRGLTASERIRHQQAVRKLETDGLIELEPRFIRLTDAGREHVAKLGASVS